MGPRIKRGSKKHPLKVFVRFFVSLPLCFECIMNVLLSGIIYSA